MQVSIKLNSKRLYIGDRRLDNPDSVTIPVGVTAVIGPNGGGKSTLGEIVKTGWNFRTNSITCPQTSQPVIAKIQFADIHSLSQMSVEYYQQRYEATANDNVPTVGEVIGPTADLPLFKSLSQMMNLPDVSDRRINHLSSGELRKLLIISNISQHQCDMLILDNPYIGLDTGARASLDKAIKSLSAYCSVMMLVSDPDDIPRYAATVIPVKDMKILPPVDCRDSIESVARAMQIYFDYAVDVSGIPDPPRLDNEPLDTVVSIDDITVAHGDLKIIDRFSWIIRPGEHWGLSGPNGSGKSTLLSLLTADNPKAYALNISLFGRRRGSGESIWDIKRRVAYISPELALHFNPSGNVLTIIAGALNDTSGIYTPITPGQERMARRWMQLLHISDLAPRRWSSLSSGEQQLVLLARVFIKQPRLIILDEPFHALDYARKRAVRAIINFIAARAAARPAVTPANIIVVSHNSNEIPECLTHFMTLKR